MSKLILAVPGSGKTTSLASEIKRQISGGVDSNKVYAITFTREAARELVDKCPNGVHASTIHSLAYALHKGKESPNDIEILESGIFYDELIYRGAIAAAQFSADLLAIDEAQDLSELQFNFLKELAVRSKEVLVVGDPMQAIFGFQQGDPTIMSRFPHIVPGMTTSTLGHSYRIPSEIASFLNVAFTPPVRIEPDREGGEVHLHVMPEKKITEGICARIVDDSGVLFRTNAEIYSTLRCLGRRASSVNYTLPLSAHPYVAFATAVVSLGLTVSPIDIIGAASLLGGLSWNGVSTLRRMTSLRFNRDTIEKLFGSSHLAVDYDYHLIPAIGSQARKDIYNLIETLDMYKEYYGKLDSGAIHSLIGALRNDGYTVEELWRSVESDDALVDSVKRKVIANAETYFNVFNGGTTTLMTIHAAKGKEFSHVVMSVNAKSVNIYDQEELRVLYVGGSRARESLDIFVPEIYSHDRSRPNILDAVNKTAGII